MPHRPAPLGRLLTVVSALLVSGACERSAVSTTDATIVRDSAGVTIVTSLRAQWPDGGGWRIDSVPRTSLGGVEADSAQHWRAPDAVTVLRDGRVVIGVEGELRWFAPDGTHTHTNLAGDGPGEFRRVAALHTMPGDSVRAHDGQGLKYAVFAPDGSLAYERRTDYEQLRALGRWIECWTRFFPDASRTMCQADPAIPASPTNRASRRLSNGLTSPGPGLLRTLHRVWLVTPGVDRAFPLGVEAGIEQFGIANDGEELFVLHPFYSRSVVTAGGEPMRIAMALNPAYRIELWTPGGALERIIVREGARRAPTSDELADVPEALRQQLSRRDPTLLDRVLAEVPTPDSLPALQHVTFTSRGELLVMREGLLPSHAQSLYDVFDRSGVWLGTLRLRPQQYIVSASDDTLLAMRRTEDGVVLVEVYGYTR